MSSRRPHGDTGIGVQPQSQGIVIEKRRRKRYLIEARLLAALVLLGAVCAGSRAAESPVLDRAAAAAAIVADGNALRQRNGLAALAPDAALARAAEAFAQYMARTGHYGHTADGRRPRDRANAQGYEDCIVDENIGWIERSAPMTAADLAGALYEGWAASPPHRRNLLDPDVTDTAVGVARSDAGRWYGVQMFGRPRSASITFSLSDAGGAPLRYRVGDRAFTLEPRVTNTHRLCRPEQLVVEPGTADEIDIAPATGAHYVAVPQASGGWRLETR